MTSLADTPLAELLLARGLVGRPILAEALAHVRADRARDPHLSLGIFLLQRGVLPANVIESALRHLAGSEGAAPASGGAKGWGHVSTLEDAPAPVEGSQAERLGPYRLLRKLAEGGMGAVFEVEHESMGGRFALKTIKRDACQLLGEDSLVRLQREARLTAEVDHPQVVKIHAADFEGETPYLVQDLLVKGSLQGRIERSGRLSPEQAVALVASLAEGLAAAHAHEILHRDLKPDNVLFNERDEPVIVDFGLARRVGQNSVSLTQAGEILGTPSYMAPEQAIDATEASSASDVYALGAILYFVLEGRPPFVGETVLETLSLVLTEPPPIAEHAPPALGEAIAQLLAKEPSERPPAGDVSSLLERALSGGARSSALSSYLWLAALTGVLLLGLGAGLWARSPARSSPTPIASPTATRLLPSPSPRARLEGVAAALEGVTPHLRALAAIDLLALAPGHDLAPAARRELRRLKREPLAEFPALRGHRNLAWLARDRIAAATATQLYTLDLRGAPLEWIEEGPPSKRLPGRIEARGDQAWLTLARPRALLDLAPGRQGRVIEADPDWSLPEGSLVSLAISPSGSWALTGGFGDLVLWDLQERRAAAHLLLPNEARRDDVQVEKLVFLDEVHAFGILNLRQPGSNGSLAPAEGHLFQVRRSGTKLELVGLQPLGISGHALAVGGGRIFASGDGGGFCSFRLETFQDGWDERLGILQEGVRRVVGVAWVGPGHLVAGRDVNSSADRVTELGRWRREGEKWIYTKIATGDRLRAIFYAPERELLLASARQSSASRGSAGAVWYLGDVDK